MIVRVSGGYDAELLPAAGYVFDIRVERDVRQVFRSIQRLLTDYKDEKRGPTFVAVQSQLGLCCLSCFAPLISCSQLCLQLGGM